VNENGAGARDVQGDLLVVIERNALDRVWNSI